MSTALENVRAAEAANPYPSTTLRFEERREAIRAYRERDRQIRDEFKNDLIEEFAADLPRKVGERVWDYAWEEGHSEGYERVEQYFEEMAEFARFARTAKEV